ncbi:MAG: methylenetetrahydrofolate--tRNA-(uracil(54)-C(5))-methyltransferase (FADH(2)-oxidizing) TrmFO [Phoenicibacter congonensis]|uniref:Methylenetetrahydrofolate--tRNA-(uracil-5-)-methyltransferase TrmFO n=1 Tax=Phoenicibacter congonensis TaxID=1944646 RepID=A0AA43RFS7_9ACTN|nr:methylenetetrahydrofolate--tRNA-(uracil(54)-C(5))-methyltransferase (FADH(2)-oxidizing) TrmFO [Phoenicibacter congonensis]
MNFEGKKIAVIGGGLAGSETALQLAKRGLSVTLFEMRPQATTPVHKSSGLAELVCSNSLKSTKPSSAAGMLKHELDVLGSFVYRAALNNKVEAGGALAVDRDLFSQEITHLVEGSPNIEVVRQQVASLSDLGGFDAIIVASGPMTSESLANSIFSIIGEQEMHFYDAAAPIVMADSLNYDVLFGQNRYEDATDDSSSDYLNAPFTKEEYLAFIEALLDAEKVILKDFERKELFSACQPIEEIARSGVDAPRFGPLKPVGLTDPRTGKRPWAVVQLRSENRNSTAFNLVGFQTNLTFPEQKRVFHMIPGLENAEFARYGVMHKNIFVNAPQVLDKNLKCDLLSKTCKTPVFIAGQLSGTEGYLEAVRSGLHAAISVVCELGEIAAPELSSSTVFGSLIDYACDNNTIDYQPMHVNFGIIAPLEQKIKNKQQRYCAYQERGDAEIEAYKNSLIQAGVF